MRKVTDIRRHKKVFNIDIKEIKSGEWLEEVPDSDMVELEYKKGYLVITDCQIRQVRTAKEGESNGIRDGQDNKA